MGLLETEIQELRKLSGDVMSGAVKIESAAAMLAIYNQVAKREELLFKVLCLSIKNGKALRLAQVKNLVSINDAIDIDDESTMVTCPLKGNQVISRSACLDYSGDSRNIDSCQKCEQFEITRQRFYGLLGGESRQLEGA